MSEITRTTPAGATNRPFDGGLLNALGRAAMLAADTIATWGERRRQRMALESLPDHLLSDIGVSRADAAQESDKPFWKG